MKLTKTQKYLVWNVGAWSLYDGLTTGFLAAFLLILGASNLLIGILGALPFFAILIAQIPGAKILEFFSRKYVYVMSSFISRSFWIFIIVLPLLAGYFSSNTLIVLVLLFYILVKSTEQLTEPAKLSLIADVVEEKQRGEFFGKLFVSNGFAGIIAFLFGGIYLKIFGDGLTGFITLFTLGALVGYFSIYVFNKVKEPKYRDHDHHTLKELFTMKGELKKYLVFVFYFYFAFMFASPFFTVYMLKDLGIDYAYFGFLTALATLVSVIAQKHLGKLTDKFGDKQIAMMSIFGTSLVPLVYFFISKENIWMLIPAQIISGLVWGGANLTIFNLLIDFTDKEKRAFQIAEFNLLTSFPLIISPIIGGLVADKVHFAISGIQLVFLIGFVLRASSVFLLNRIKEPRAKTKYGFEVVFRGVMAFHATEGLLRMTKTVVKRIRNLQ